MKFIDLFAGIGGFHVGLSKLGHECVFASEISKDLQRLYSKNFNIEVNGDIQKIDVEHIPKHDILCAGFPCQPFSKAGSQEGMNDIVRGNLFQDIARILDYHKPQYFILENVPNLKSHDNRNTWKTIIDVLQNHLGYSVQSENLSPHQFGVPQIRDRIFIVGSLNGLEHFEWPSTSESVTNIRSILAYNSKDAKKLPERENNCLDIWQEFLNRIPKSAKLPSFPIWSMEFGATYPFEKKAPFHLQKSELEMYLGEFGASLNGMNKSCQLERLPNYSRGKQKKGEFPTWKKNYIRQNRAFFEMYKKELAPLLSELQKMPPSWQKFEWNCQGEVRDLNQLIIQFRGSGIRVKRSNYSPALVASTSTQIPIIGWDRRYLSKFEAAKLQSLDEIELPALDGPAFKALGNAVNAKIVERIAANLIIPLETKDVKLIKDYQLLSNY